VRDRLELACLQAALGYLHVRPPDTSLTVNLSGPLLLDARTAQLLAGTGPLDGLIIELTENSLLEDTPGLHARISELQVAGVRFAVDAYVTFARTRPWVEAVASSLTELFGPAAIRVRLEALERHYPWIDAAGLEYFRTRLVKAPRDADYALALTVERCRTREHQEAAIAALRFKTEMLWAQLDAIERGDSQNPIRSAARA